MSNSAKVLILSNLEDTHVAKVVQHLDEMQVHSDLFEYEDFINKFSLAYSVATEYASCSLESEQKTLDLTSYSAVWHRRPGQLRTPHSIEPWIDRIIENEARSALTGIWQTMDCTWVNNPVNDSIALHKLAQLDLARRVGFSIPRTIVTNKPQAVREFYKECGGRVIYKFISELSVLNFPQNERPAGMGTTVLREKDLPFLEQVSYAPHIFQQRIEKEIELRMTAVGTRIFCTSIDSLAGKGAIDWRNDYSVAMQPFELPASVSSKCLEMMRFLGLNYGAFDLILDNDKNYVFIEINCAGQYLWAEKRTGVPISLAMAELLAGRIEPLVENPRSFTWPL